MSHENNSYNHKSLIVWLNNLITYQKFTILIVIAVDQGAAKVLWWHARDGGLSSKVFAG